eukprot:TRINITY_DN10704_c0_g1_i5.p1 TRINITY_DN10704_c0_g1~~TRINITY_DN10704_c0_g1_i5.p1  ORF type:complete len:199 (+),score=29.90 TRINITY_DN10704_c0_g1_i5:112-708(+)
MSDTRIKRLLSTDELLPFTRCSPSSNVAHAFGLVKREPRRGWLDFGVERPESVADHMHRMALLTFNLPDQVEMIATPGELVPINLDRCVRMCLVHDLAEGLTGDLTPRDNVTKTDKQKLEQEGMATTTADMDSQRRQGLMAVWQEYEDRSTAEAIVVKDLDMYEMCVQAPSRGSSKPGTFRIGTMLWSLIASMIHDPF